MNMKNVYVKVLLAFAVGAAAGYFFNQYRTKKETSA
jgi:Na+/H+-dicarboxylate symporter